MAINITSPQTGQIDRTQSSIPVTWTNSDSIYNGHQSSYEIQYKYVADASWSTLGKVTSPAQQGDLKGIFTALGTDAKEIYYRICVRYDLFTSSSLGAKAGGVDYSAVYSIIFRGGDQIGTLKIYDGSAIKEHPIYESVSGQPKLNVRVSSSQTGQVPLVPEGDRQAGNIKVAVTASDVRVAASAPRYTVSNQYANGYFYGYKYKYSTNYGYYHYISSYYRNYAYRTDSYNSSKKWEFRLDRAEYYHYTYYSYDYTAYRIFNYRQLVQYLYLQGYYNTYASRTNYYNSAQKRDTRLDRAEYYHYTYYGYWLESTPTMRYNQWYGYRYISSYYNVYSSYRSSQQWGYRLSSSAYRRGYLRYSYSYYTYNYYSSPSTTGSYRESYLVNYYNRLQTYQYNYYRTYSYNYAYVHSYSYYNTYTYITGYYGYSYQSYVYGYSKQYISSYSYYRNIAGYYNYSVAYSYISSYYSYIASYYGYNRLATGSYRYGYSYADGTYYNVYIPPMYTTRGARYRYTTGTRYYYYYYYTYGSRWSYGNARYSTGYYGATGTLYTGNLLRTNYSYRWEYAWAYAYNTGAFYDTQTSYLGGARWNYDGRGTGGYGTAGTGSYLQPVGYYNYYTRYYGYYYKRFESGTYLKLNDNYQYYTVPERYSSYGYYNTYYYISSRPAIYSSGGAYYVADLTYYNLVYRWDVQRHYVAPVYSYYNYYTRYAYTHIYISTQPQIYNYTYFYYTKYQIQAWIDSGVYSTQRYVGPVYSYYSYYTTYYYRRSYHSSNTTVYGTTTHITSYNDLSYHYKYYRRG